MPDAFLISRSDDSLADLLFEMSLKGVDISLAIGNFDDRCFVSRVGVNYLSSVMSLQQNLIHTWVTQEDV